MALEIEIFQHGPSVSFMVGLALWDFYLKFPGKSPFPGSRLSRPNFDKRYIPTVIVRSWLIRAQFEDPNLCHIFSDIIITTPFNSGLVSASRAWTSIQRSAKVLVHGLVKFVPGSWARKGTNFTKARTKTLADLCTQNISAPCWYFSPNVDAPSHQGHPCQGSQHAPPPPRAQQVPEGLLRGGWDCSPWVRGPTSTRGLDKPKWNRLYLQGDTTGCSQSFVTTKQKLHYSVRSIYRDGL